MIRKSSPRMQGFDYLGAHAYHVVISAQGDHEPFRNGGVVRSCGEALARSADRCAFSVEAFCFMPDHLHILAVGGEGSSLLRFIQHFKQLTAYQHRNLWQRSFYDRVLRREEDLDTVATYVWSNPVVAGLVEDAADYPFSGPPDKLIAMRGGSVIEDRAEALSLQVDVGARSEQARGTRKSNAEDRAEALSLRVPQQA